MSMQNEEYKNKLNVKYHDIKIKQHSQVTYLGYVMDVMDVLENLWM